jgi:hypothetical protein
MRTKVIRQRNQAGVGIVGAHDCKINFTHGGDRSTAREEGGNANRNRAEMSRKKDEDREE